MAFITAETRSDLIELSVAMLKQAPSAALLEELIALSVGGGSLADAADHIAKTAAFKAEYPSFQTAEQYAAEIFDNITTGGTVTADIRTAVIELATGMLTSGSVTKAGLALAIAEYLAAPAALLNTDFADIAQSFQNRADAAEYFVVTKELGGSTDAELAAAIASVTSDAATLTAANTAADATASAEAVVAGQTFTLTTSQDATTGSAGADSISGSLVGAGATGTTAQPGDTINAGEGSDKLTLSVSGDSGGAYTLQALITDSVETLHVNNFETDAANGGAGNTVTTIDGALMKGLTEVGLASSGAEGDTKFANVMNIVDVAMQNGSGDLEVAYGSGVTTGTQTQNIALSNVAAGTLKIAGVENLNISSGLVKSTLTALTAANMQTLTVTGSTDLKITGALDFKDASSATALDGTVDASDFTGKLTVTSAADVVSITGGSGNDTINMAGTLNGLDTVNGGDGTDTLTMDAAALTTQFAKVSNVENVTLNNSTAAVAVDASKLSAGVDMLTLDLTDAAEATGAKLASTVTKADGLLINLVKSVEDQADANDSDGTKLTITDSVDTTDDTVNIRLTNIGVDNHAATDYFGIDEIDVSTFETVNITANKNALGTASANEVEALTATVAKTIKVDGTGDLETVLTGTKVTTFDASELAGKLTLTAGTEKATYSMGGKSSTIVFAGNLNASDTVIGGAGAADIVTATVTGLTATTGALNTSDVEYVLLTTSGANTLDLSGTTGLSNLAVTDNKQTIKGIDLETTTIHLGLDGDNSVGTEIDVTAADATGADDTLKVIVNTTANAATPIIDASDIENLSLIVGSSAVGAATSNDATINMTTFEGSKVTIANAGLSATTTTVADALVDLGTLHKNTTSVVSANGEDVTVSFANATTAVTYEGLGAGIQTVTGGLRGDTFTIGSTGAVVHVIDGGAGTDTLNLAVKTGFVDVGDINVENINITVPASVDITIDAAQEFNAGVDNITLTGGNSLSTFAAQSLATGIKTFDASGFLGNITADFAADLHDGTVKVTGGQQATDSVTAVYTTAATYTPSMEGVESLVVDINDDITVSLAGSTGLGRVSADLVTNKTGTISNVGAVDSRIVIAASGSTLEVKPVDATDEDNSVNVSLKAAVNAASIADGVKIKTTDVETVNITALSSESVDLSTLTMSSATKTVTLNVLGSAASPGVLTASATAAQITTINAAGAVGFVQTGRSATTKVDYTGSIGNDTFIMMTTGDKIAGGAGTGDTLDVNYGAVLGGISVDLSASGEQISTLDGGAISGSVTGFENVDLSGYTGFGASVTAIKTGSTITGTGSIDRITGGAGADTITGGGGNDIITTGAGIDTVNLAAGSADTIADFTVGTDIIGSLAAIATTSGAGAFKQITAAGAEDFGADGIFVVAADTATASATMTAAQVEAAVLTGFANVGAETAIAVITADTDAESTVYIYSMTSDAGTDIDSVELIGVLNNVEVDNLTAADFGGFT